MIAALTVILILLIFGSVVSIIHRKQGVRWRTIFGISLLAVFALLFLSRFLILCGADRLDANTLEQLSEIRSFSELRGVEKLSVGIVAAFQTFSLDADYTLFILAGRSLLQEMKGGAVLAEVYSGLVSLLNVAAPLLGGAVLLDVLTDVFPGIRLRFMHRRRPKYVFSELNESALSVAADLLDKEHARSERNYVKLQEFWYSSGDAEGLTRLIRLLKSRIPPLIVFTDAYVNEKEERGAELIARAKAMGAICIREDLLHLDLSRSGFLSYFFIDRKEQNNIGALSQLLDMPWIIRMISRSDRKGTQEAAVRLRCYVFTDSVSADQLVSNIKKQHHVETASLIIRVINSHKTVALNLMSSVPLFYPLLRNEASLPDAETPVPDRPGTLTVSILGDSPAAEELFKAVFWCGQMARYTMHIHVFSNHAPEDNPLMKRLSLYAPDVLKTCNGPWLDSALLRLHEDGGAESNPPYAAVQFHRCDTDSDELFSRYADVIKATDYFIVTLGIDERNIRVSQALYLYLERPEAVQPGRHRIIACAANDPAISLSAGQRSEEYGVEMICFGSVSSVFSCRNVFMSGFTPNSLQPDNRFSIREYLTDKDEIYLSASHMARKMHLSYRLFDLGLIRLRAAEANEAAPTREVWHFEDEALQDRLVQVLDSAANPEKAESTARDLAAQYAWVEHRRWNAYMRTLGFCSPNAEVRRALCRANAELILGDCLTEGKGGKYRLNCKDIPRKLHSCLAETKRGSVFDAHADDRLTAVSKVVNEQFHEVFAAAGWSEARLGYRNYLLDDLPNRADEFPRLRPTAVLAGKAKKKAKKGPAEPVFQDIADPARFARACIAHGAQPIRAKKTAEIRARQGKPGETIRTVVSGGLTETVNHVRIDEQTGKPGWIVDNPGGEQYIVSDHEFCSKYAPAPDRPGVFLPKSAPVIAVPTPCGIRFGTSWGEMKLQPGGWLILQPGKAIYGIQRSEMEKTYTALPTQDNVRQEAVALLAAMV